MVVLHEQHHHRFEDEQDGTKVKEAQMSDNTRTTGTVVALYNPNDDSWNSPVDDNGTRQIQAPTSNFTPAA